jgi:hypothetical protein
VVYNGALYVSEAETNSSGGSASCGGGANTNTCARIVRFTEGPIVNNELSSFVNTTPGRLGTTTSIVRVSAMTVYNGVLYASTNKSNAAEVYRYDGSSETGGTGTSVFTAVSSSAGTIASGGTASIDNVATMTPFNDKLYVGTDESNSAEVYQFSQVEGQSNRLLFNASSDNAGSTEQTNYPNQGSIFFNAERNGTNVQGAATGSFIFSNSISTATGNYDVAEDYATRDDTLKPGDLVAIDPHETGFVRKASGSYDSGIVGVYSEKPALRLTQQDATINGGRAIPVALAGRVPVSVSTENGAILPGDPLTSSSVPGVSMKATRYGRIVGMAMEPYDGVGPGKVMGFVNPNFYSGQSTVQGGSTQSADLTLDGKISANSLEVSGTATTKDLIVTGEAKVASLNVTGTATVGSLTSTGTITTKNMTITSEAMINLLTVEVVTIRGDLSVGGNLYIGQAQSKNAITKEFTAGKDLTAGEVVVADPAHDNQVTTTTKAGDTKVVGIVLDDAKSGTPVKVAIGGTIQAKTDGGVVAGDVLASSATEGAAAKQDPPQVGAIVGKALSKPEKDGLTWILVALQ